VQDLMAQRRTQATRGRLREWNKVRVVAHRSLQYGGSPPPATRTSRVEPAPDLSQVSQLYAPTPAALSGRTHAVSDVTRAPARRAPQSLA
jgi:hypothetical protein